jgi:hypothetical protein
MAKISTERREKTTYTLTSEELAQVLCEHLALTYSKNAKLTFAIRRGHDALGTTVNLGAENSIALTRETVTGDDAPVEVSDLTPAEKKYRENQRVKNPDNNDAKLDLIAQILGLDPATATGGQCVQHLEELVLRIEDAVKLEKE